MTASSHEPSARHYKRRRPAPRAGLLAFLVLALCAAGAGFVVRAPAEQPPTAAADRYVPVAVPTTTSGTAPVGPGRSTPPGVLKPALPSTSGDADVLPAGTTPPLSASSNVRFLGSATPVTPGSPMPTRAPGPAPADSGAPSVALTPSVSPSATPATSPAPSPTKAPTATPTPAPLRTPTMRVSTGASKVLTGSRTRPQLVINGLPAGYRGTATLRLYGPAAQQSGISCQSDSLFHTQTITVTVDATYTGYDVRLDRAGYYGWSVTLPGSTTSAPVSSGCAPAGAVVQASQW